MSSVQRYVKIAAREPGAHQRATIWSIVSPCASRRDLVQPSGREGTSSSARSDRVRAGAASKCRTEGTNFFHSCEQHHRLKTRGQVSFQYGFVIEWRADDEQCFSW